MPSFCDATTAWFCRERRLRNERKNFKVITYHYPDLGSASNWLKQTSLATRPIRSTTQILDSDMSSVWNFCARFSDVIWRGNQW